GASYDQPGRAHLIVSLRQDGSANPAFHLDPLLGDPSSVDLLGVAADGRLTVNTRPLYSGIFRLLPSGTIDRSFLPPIIHACLSTGCSPRLFSLADGSLLWVGQFGRINGFSSPIIHYTGAATANSQFITWAQTREFLASESDQRLVPTLL